MAADLREPVQEEHERFGGVSGRDAVELDPVGSHILVGTQAGVQQARRGDCRQKERKTTL